MDDPLIEGIMDLSCILLAVRFRENTSAYLEKGMQI